MALALRLGRSRARGPATVESCRGLVAAKRHVVADEDAVADGQGQAHRLIVRVADTDREATTVKAGFEVEDAEHLHAILRDGVLVPHHADVPEAQGFCPGLRRSRGAARAGGSEFLPG